MDSTELFKSLELPHDDASEYYKPENREAMSKFFYKGEAFEKLKASSTYYLIGDKGSGKTAYSAYFCSRTVEGNIKSRYYSICVDDYNKIIQMKNEGKLAYTDYVTLWKAFLLIKICSTLNHKEISLVGKPAFSKVRALLDKYNFTEFTEDTFSPISFMDSSEFEKNGAINVKKQVLNHQAAMQVRTVHKLHNKKVCM